jgi:glycogen operon protein
MTGDLATALAGSSPIFGRDGRTRTRSVNFLAAHDGFTLLDLVSNANKHNDANGEQNRDGHNENLSWNNGTEGATDDREILQRRRTDVMALLSTLFATRGTIMISAGDEGGRSQHGNNNAYCQDNEITWLDWAQLDETLVSHTAFVSTLRKRFSIFAETAFLTDEDVEWLSPDGTPMTVSQWQTRDFSTLAMVLKTRDNSNGKPSHLAFLINRAHAEQAFALPSGGAEQWLLMTPDKTTAAGEKVLVPARSVRVVLAG